MPLSLSHPPVSHLPVLFIASALTFGGLMPFWDPAAALSSYGFSKRVASSPEAAPVMIGCSGRSTAMGLGLFSLYFQGQHAAVDTVLVPLAYVGLVDAWLCARERMYGMAWTKALAGLFLGGYGWMRLTERSG